MMEYSKKLLIIDPTKHSISGLAENERQKRDFNTPPIKREMSRLDTEMLEIINSEAYTEQEKVDLYNQTLSRFQELYRQTKPLIKAPQTLSNSDTTELPEPNLKPEVEGELTFSFPKTQRNLGSKLVKFLKNDPEISWLSNGTVILKGVELPGSNITDLISKAAGSKKRSLNLTGWEQFSKLFSPHQLRIQSPRVSKIPRFKKTTKEETQYKWQKY